ncbi:MAG: SIS domain-containing protein [Dehalococcoidia bacterium]|nr:SIS domain-containing protein [Dehalococcoidia bacterium]
MEIDSALSQLIASYTGGIKQAIQGLPLAELERVILRLEEARWKGQRVFTCGNGGSAVTAVHFAADLQKGAMAEGKPVIDSECLCDNVARFSAWANDTSYEDVFVGAMKCKVKEGSVLIAISGSGNSPNVLNAVEAARAQGATTIGLTGFDGGKLKDTVDICVLVPSHSMEQVEDAHLLLCHLFTYCLRNMPAVEALLLQMER